MKNILLFSKVYVGKIRRINRNSINVTVDVTRADVDATSYYTGQLKQMIAEGK